MKLNYKVIIAGLIPMLLYMYGSYIYIQNIQEKQLNEKYIEVSHVIYNEVKTLITEKKEAILLLSLALSENHDVKEMLLDKHKEIHLKEFSLKLKKYSSLHNVWFQVVSREGVSLYRSWTSKHGDSILHARKDIIKLLKHPQVLSPISVGKFDMTFKSIVPIFEQGRFLGLVETIAKFNSISRKLQQFGSENLLLVDKSYKKQLQVSPKYFLKDYYIANYRTASPFLLDVVAKDIQKYISIPTYIIKNGFLITSYSIEDIDEKDMAYFILAKDLKTINTSEIQSQVKALIALFVLIYIGIGVLLYYVYIFNYKKLVSRQKELLEKNVALKTKELQKKSQKLKHQAEHDSLTHLPNRFLFLDRLKQALKQAQREQQVVSVLFLDLDRFKEINDTYGHDVGDKLLQLVTKRLLRARRKEDTVARLGGDEFTILLQDVSQNSVIHIVNKIIESMQEPFIINGMKHYTTFSIGISSYPDDADNAEDLLRNADTAMYKAKEGGKNRYYFYHAEMTKLAFERIELEKELRRALENDEFEAYFQPKIDAKQHKVTGLEALIRWQHPIKGMIFPDKFIPFAEEIGLIGAIDDVMMRLSIQQVLEWHRKGIECGKISINLSARQLTSKNYIQELEETINDIGLDTRYIEIEITETHIMENPQHAMDILNKIRALGISISIDDFGTGYSSLSYLKKLPVTKLKIDRSFVMELPYDKDDVAIVKTIISLAKNLDLEIIAEGVEEKAQVDFLVREGCDNIQGYYFSKPLSKEDCEKFLKTFE